MEKLNFSSQQMLRKKRDLSQMPVVFIPEVEPIKQKSWNYQDFCIPDDNVNPNPDQDYDNDYIDDQNHLYRRLRRSA